MFSIMQIANSLLIYMFLRFQWFIKRLDNASFLFDNDWSCFREIKSEVIIAVAEFF